MTGDVVEGMAEAVEARRRELRLSPGALAEAAGLTRQGLARVRAGHRRRYASDTIYGIAEALCWGVDWYDRLLAGEAPEEIPDAGADATIDEVLAEVRALREELAQLRGERTDNSPGGH